MKSVGNFREDFTVCEDYELWLRIAAKYDVGFLPEPLIKKYGGHEDQLSKQFFAMDYFRVKALNFHKNSPLITEEERKLLKRDLTEKMPDLIKWL